MRKDYGIGFWKSSRAFTGSQMEGRGVDGSAVFWVRGDDVCAREANEEIPRCRQVGER